MQFGCALPHILQSIWEEDPVKGTVLVYNMDFTDAYDCGTFRMYQVVSFAYVVPSAAADDCVIICIDLVLMMVWVDSPKYFCAI